MTKFQYEVQVNTVGGQTLTFTDSTDTPGAGGAAYQAIAKHDDILAMSGTGSGAVLVYIPNSSIDFATISVDATTVDKPEDTNCQTEDETGPDDSEDGPDDSED